MCFTLDIQVELQEEDGKGNYHSVAMDKDCFKLRPHVKKKVVFTVSQSNSARPLPLERWVWLISANYSFIDLYFLKVFWITNGRGQRCEEKPDASIGQYGGCGLQIVTTLVHLLFYRTLLPVAPTIACHL